MSLSRVISTTVMGMRGPEGQASEELRRIGAAAVEAKTQLLAAVSQTRADPSRLTPWTPAQIDLIGWWDPADRATLSMVGGEVQRIADKSGAGLAFTSISPTKRAGYDTSGAAAHLVFDGTGRAMKTVATTIKQPATFFMAVYDIGSSNAQQTGIDVGNRILMRTRQAAGPMMFAGEGLVADGDLLPRDHYHVLIGSVSNGVGALSVDGNAELVGPVGDNDAEDVPILIGDSMNADAPLYGGVGDIVIAPFKLSPGDDLHDRVTGWLAWKYASHENLPADHPYRYAPPVTGRVPVAAEVYRGTTMIPHGAAGSWYETNIFDPRIVTDPLDADYLLLYTTGQAAPIGTGTASIGFWRAKKADFAAYIADPSIGSPWAAQGVIFTQGAAGAWDAQGGGTNGVRLGSLVVLGDGYTDAPNGKAGSIVMYYSSQPTGAVGKATSTDGGRTFQRFANNPILTPAGQGRVDGNDVSNPYVLLEDGVWHMIYTYRTATEVLPGYRYARSVDGETWTKSGDGDVLTRPHRGLQLESLQLLKRNGAYFLVMEMGGNPGDATPYREYVAVANIASGPYTIKKCLLTESGEASATSDKYHVATPFLYSLDGVDILLWQGAGDHAQPYATNHWDLFAAQVVNAL